MTLHPDADARDETPVWFPAGESLLFGILSRPRDPGRGVGVVLLNGGAYTPSPSRNRFSVKLARRLAARGFSVLRFDWHGTGESGGQIVRYSLNRPWTTDVVGAVSELRRRGLDEVILIGRCFGARTALSAVGQVEKLKGMALISLPLREFGVQEEEGQPFGVPRLQLSTFTGLLNPKRRRWHLRVLYYSAKRLRKRLRAAGRNGADPVLDWVSDAVVGWLRQAVLRRIPLLLMYGTKWSAEDHAAEFRQAATGEIGRVLAQAGERAQVTMLDGPVHELTTVAVQEDITAHVLEWVESLTRMGVPAGAGR